MVRNVLPIAPYLVFILVAGTLVTSATNFAWATPPSTPCVADVESSFARIEADRGRALAMKTGSFFTGRSYTQSPLNRLGLDNHFQGIQPLADSRYWAFTGADFIRRRASLFFAKSRSDLSAPRVFRRFDIGDRKLWHAGGVARSGEVLVVPLEAYRITQKSRIVFYDVSNPENPRAFPFSIERPNSAAGAVALTRLADGRYLLLVYDNGIVDFYRSRESDISAGFDESTRIRRDWRKLSRGYASTISFIPQCDGSLYLLSFRNTGKAPPLLMNGHDLAELSLFEWRDGDPVARGLDSQTYYCGTRCNFAGAAGAHLNAAGNLEVWSTYSFRNLSGNRIRMRIFD